MSVCKPIVKSMVFIALLIKKKKKNIIILKNIYIFINFGPLTMEG